MRGISISSCFDYAIPIERQLPMLRRAGFEFVSFGANDAHSGLLDKSRRQALKRQLSEEGLSVDTIHGCDMDKPDAIAVNQRLADAALELNAPVIVLHCSAFSFDPSELITRRNDIYQKLPLYEKIARTSGIRFAFENVAPGTATDFMEEVLCGANPACFGFCYDVSHDQIDGPRPFDLLARQRDRLMAVHLSDRIREFVDHVIPGEGFIDFDRLCSLLRRALFKFPLLMEVMTMHSRYQEPEEFLAAAYREAEKLHDRIFAKAIRSE